MTSSYKHRFARTFHQISREHPDMPVGERFSMVNVQLREARLTQLIAQLQSYDRLIPANPTASPPQTSGTLKPPLVG